ncbi:hypothetical protein FSP39_008733 [Pinctada imbricata]|uniref:nitric-oxide synthase (NADPH) n=1 Tax=Pinctada imbricata TaxID=66713 RepID=A0AA88YG03_PINIB|nr:hypothetical protein FSP39_008733 [Pinctada imbricata]
MSSQQRNNGPSMVQKSVMLHNMTNDKVEFRDALHQKTIELFDSRKVKTAKEMFDCICRHIKYATNKGNIRSAITIFPHRTDGLHDFRVFNQQVIRYAGYRQTDGSVIGDPVNIDFTESLGWEGKNGMFDVLPLVLQANGEEPEVFEIPPDLVLEVDIKHPKFQKISDMNLKWFALPGVSNMMFDCGGLEFTAAPFSGWYMETEIGARDFCDAQRYNLAEKVALKMGLDTKDTSSLWKDKAAIEMNVAVLHSYREQGVTIMDHHSASESFMTFFENEQKTRGGCPADWVWIVPPISGSLTEVFHQEMLMYKLKPSYEYQDEIWRSYVKGSERTRKLDFRSVAIATKVIVRAMRAILAERKRCVVLYATETGRSEKFAKQLFRIFESSFNAKIFSTADYDMKHVQKEDLVLVVASTTGNGDPPENGKTLKKSLQDLQAKFKKSTSQETPYSDIAFSVFGLGSTAYPHFCAFAKFIDEALKNVGMQRISKLGQGDELSGQDETFKRWSKTVFKDACKKYQIREDTVQQEDMDDGESVWKPGKFRISQIDHQEEPSLAKCSRETILLKLDTSGNTQLKFAPGDHLAIYPVNSSKLVDGIISRLKDPSKATKLMSVEVAHQKSVSWVEWEDYKRLPVCTIRTALNRFLDITTPPSLEFMKALAMQTGKRKDIAQIENLVNDIEGFEEWKQVRDPNILEVLEMFPSVRIDPTLLLTQLSLLQQRYYSISSSPKAYPREIHATVAVLKYNTMGGDGPEHEGVCSTWLNKCAIGETVYCAIRDTKSIIQKIRNRRHTKSGQNRNQSKQKQKPPPYEKKRTPDMRVRPGAQEE